jgi:glyoxylase-like metal-dependent hydrolase (beta-lactamase superfamily II)
MEIVPGVYDIDLGLVHAYLYQESDRLTLIDTGLATSAQTILDAIEAFGRKPRDLHQIVVTHYHADHTGAAAELAERTGAAVLAHALDAPVVRGEAGEAPAAISDIEREYYERAKQATPVAPPARVDRELQDGDEIDVAAGARTVHVPGHTPGSIGVYVPKRRLLFAGDAAARMPEGRLMVGVFNADTARARASFARLAALDIEAVFFGHGRPLDKDASTVFRRTAQKLALQT